MFKRLEQENVKKYQSQMYVFKLVMLDWKSNFYPIKSCFLRILKCIINTIKKEISLENTAAV